MISHLNEGFNNAFNFKKSDANFNTIFQRSETTAMSIINLVRNHAANAQEVDSKQRQMASLSDISNPNFWNKNRVHEAEQTGIFESSTKKMAVTAAHLKKPMTPIVKDSFETLLRADITSVAVNKDSSHYFVSASNTITDLSTYIKSLLNKDLADHRIMVALWFSIHLERPKVIKALLELPQAKTLKYCQSIERIFTGDARALKDIHLKDTELELNKQIVSSAIEILDDDVLIELFRRYSVEVTEELLTKIIEARMFKSLKFLITRIERLSSNHDESIAESRLRVSPVFGDQYITVQIFNHCVQRHSNLTDLLEELFLWTLEPALQRLQFKIWLRTGLDEIAVERVNFSTKMINGTVLNEAFKRKAYNFLLMCFKDNLVTFGIISRLKRARDHIFAALDDPKGVLVAIFFINFLTPEFFSFEFFDVILEYFETLTETRKAKKSAALFYSTNPLLAVVLAFEFFTVSRSVFPYKIKRIEDLRLELLELAKEIQSKLNGHESLLYFEEDNFNRNIFDIISERKKLRSLLNPKVGETLDSTWRGMKEGSFGDLNKMSRIVFLEHTNLLDHRKHDGQNYLTKILKFKPDEQFVYDFQYFKTKNSVSLLFQKEFFFSLTMLIYLVILNIYVFSEYNKKTSDNRNDTLTSGYRGFVGTANYILVILIHSSLILQTIFGVVFSIANKIDFFYDRWILLDLMIGLYGIVFIPGIFPTYASSNVILWYLRYIISIEIVLQCIRILYLSQMFEKFSPLLSTIIEMANKVYDFVIVFMIYMLVATMIFMLFFGDENGASYGTYGEALVTLFSSFLGNFDFYDSYTNEMESVLEKILLIIHNAISSVMLINFFIAQLNFIFDKYRMDGEVNYMLSQLRYGRKYTKAFHARHRFGYLVANPPPLNLINAAFGVFALLKIDFRGAYYIWDFINYLVSLCVKLPIFLFWELFSSRLAYLRQFTRIATAHSYGIGWKIGNLIFWLLGGPFFIFICIIIDVFYFLKLSAYRNHAKPTTDEKFTNNPLNNFVYLCRKIKFAFQASQTVRDLVADYLQKQLKQDYVEHIRNEDIDLVCKNLQIKIAVPLLQNFIKSLVTELQFSTSSELEQKLINSTELELHFSRGSFELIVKQGVNRTKDFMKSLERKNKIKIQEIPSATMSMNKSKFRGNEGFSASAIWKTHKDFYSDYLKKFADKKRGLFDFELLRAMLPDIVLDSALEKYHMIDSSLF